MTTAIRRCKYTGFTILVLIQISFFILATNNDKQKTTKLDKLKKQPADLLIPDEFINSSNWTIRDTRRRRIDRTAEYFNPDDLSASLSQVHEILPTTSNNTKQGGVIFYNRVAKCASSSIQVLLKRLLKRNRFNLQISKTYDQRILTDAEITNLMSKFQNSSALPTVVDRHFYFHKSLKRYTFFNIIRDPIKRFASSFYFARASKRWQGKKDTPPLSWFTKDINRCVLDNDKECSLGGGIGQELELTYFCGGSRLCSTYNSRSALQMAKYNIETSYSVVGIAEMMNVTLQVLQQYIPGVFKGALEEYSKLGHLDINHHPHPGLGTFARGLLMKKMENDYELFDFVKRRLLLQFKKLKNQTK